MALSPEDLKNDGFGTLVQKLNAGGGGGGGTNILVWSAFNTWADVYTDVQAAAGRAIVMVLNDGAKEMTPDPAGTDLSNVFFIGVRDGDGNLPTIDVDSALVGGFLLSGNQSLHSKDVLWQTYYQICDTPTTWEFDGGGIQSATVDSCYRANTLILHLRNGAVINGAACTDGLFKGLRDGATVYATGGCTLDDKCFFAIVGVPPFPNVVLYDDSSTTISPNVLGASVALGLVENLLDQAAKMAYDDTAEVPASGNTTVQTIIDWLKGCVSPPGHFRVDLWAGGETWDDVMARFAGGGILFVWHDGATPRDMTPSLVPGGSVDLNSTWIIGLPQADGSLPTVRVDPANLGTFVLTAQSSLRSKDLHWVMPAYVISDTPPYTQTYIELDGGSLTTVAASAGTWATQSVLMRLRNGALFDGSNCAPGKALVELTNAGLTSVADIETMGTLGTHALTSTPACPLNLRLDASGIVGPSAVDGAIVASTVLMDAAGQVSYNDLLALPASGQIQVQGVIDWLKFRTSGGNGFIPPIDTLVNLAALSTAGLPDGAVIYVNEVEDLYVLDTVGAHVADGVTVIPAAGGGFWVAREHGRWDDMQGSIAEGAGAGLLTLEFFRDTRFNMYFMRHDQDDELSFVYQFSHRWDPTTAVHPHLHILPMADPLVAQNVRVAGYYAWSRPNYAASPVPALVGWTPFTVDIPINPGDIYVQRIIALGGITPPVWARESTCLLLYFQRNGTNPADTYTTSKPGPGTPAANLGIISTDVHFRMSKPGSEAEIPT